MAEKRRLKRWTDATKTSSVIVYPETEADAVIETEDKFFMTPEIKARIKSYSTIVIGIEGGGDYSEDDVDIWIPATTTNCSTYFASAVNLLAGANGHGGEILLLSGTYRVNYNFTGSTSSTLLYNTLIIRGINAKIETYYSSSSVYYAHMFKFSFQGYTVEKKSYLKLVDLTVESSHTSIYSALFAPSNENTISYEGIVYIENCTYVNANVTDAPILNCYYMQKSGTNTASKIIMSNCGTKYTNGNSYINTNNWMYIFIDGVAQKYFSVASEYIQPSSSLYLINYGYTKVTDQGINIAVQVNDNNAYSHYIPKLSTNTNSPCLPNWQKNDFTYFKIDSAGKFTVSGDGLSIKVLGFYLFRQLEDV